MTFQDFAACIPEGFKAMVSPMLILTLAWTLSGMTGLLGAKYYVASLLSGSAAALQYLLPIIIFLVAVFLAFATGTSWGTFSILVPIVCHAFPEGEMLVVSIAACLSGAVCGDHCSPISDTTIMASAGAHCSHVNHVSTQLPYAMTAAAISAGCYLLCGAAQAVLGEAANVLTSFVLLACADRHRACDPEHRQARWDHPGKQKMSGKVLKFSTKIVDFSTSPTWPEIMVIYCKKSKFFELLGSWKENPCWKKYFQDVYTKFKLHFIKMYFSALPPARPR